MNKTLIIKKVFSALMIFAVTIGLVVAIIAFDPLAKSQLVLSNFLYHERQTKNPVVIVAINNKSFDAKIGLGAFKDWRRTYYSKVIENIEKYQPAAIGIDVFFVSPSKGISQEDIDEIIKDPLTSFSKIIQFGSNQQVHPDDQALLETIKKYSNLVFIGKFEGDTNNAKFSKPFFTESIDTRIGDGTVFADQDGLIRGIQITRADQSSFALETIKASGKKYSLPNFQNNQLLINFSTKTLLSISEWYKNNNLRIISFVDVYKDTYPQDFDPNFFKDKIVLIGAYYVESGDNQFTPIDPQNAMPGVQIHAQAIQTILDQAWLRNMTKTEQGIISIILSGLALLAIYTLKPKFALPVIVVLGAIYLGSAPALFDQGLIINLVYPPIALVIALILGYTFRFITEFKQKTLLHTALGKYVNKDIADRALTDSAQLGLTGEKRNITVIFTDIVNFTHISETLHPQSLVTLLNEYLQVMAGIITEHGGTIDKFEGDAIMAFFGAPTPQNNHAIRACEAALEMRASLKPLLEKWKNDPALPGGELKPQIDFRVGISTGDAIIGNIGFEDHIEYTAMGDIVNLGSRLESANKKYQTRVMISEETARQIDGFFELRFIDVVKVIGKDQSIKVYELQAIQGQLSETQKLINQKYHKAINLYFNRQFIEALDIFNAILKEFPNDTLSDRYAGRCEVLKRYPPSRDWDFVYSLQSK
jgi:adenylate cyclase